MCRLGEAVHLIQVSQMEIANGCFGAQKSLASLHLKFRIEFESFGGIEQEGMILLSNLYERMMRI